MQALTMVLLALALVSGCGQKSPELPANSHPSVAGSPMEVAALAAAKQLEQQRQAQQRLSEQKQK